MLDRLRLLFHRWSTRRKMNRVFSRGRDPYQYNQNPYERSRLEGMAAALGDRSFKNALEVGSAEGVFTRELSRMAAKIIGLELSPVALARSRETFEGNTQISFVEADVRIWEPEGEGLFDLIVLGDVLYYMDKPIVRKEFERVFKRLVGWVEPNGLILLAHGFAGDGEKAIRRSYRERFEALGLTLVSETVIGRAVKEGDVCCLLSLLRR